MANRVSTWWSANAYIVIAMIGYGVAVVAFAMNMKDRIDHMEQYGSPQVATLDKRLSIIELQLSTSDKKLDIIMKNLEDHVLRPAK